MVNTFESKYVILIAALTFTVLLIAAQVATAQTFVRICDPNVPPTLTIFPAQTRESLTHEAVACTLIGYDNDKPLACGMTWHRHGCLYWMNANYPQTVAYAVGEWYPPHVCGPNCSIVEGTIYRIYLPMVLKND